MKNGRETQSKKSCRTCSDVKSVESFHRSKKSKDGYQSQCKACQKARLSSPENAERRRHYAWLASIKKFGITEDQYNQMLEKQLGLCAICHKPDTIKLAVDHCHETGKVRGLLCKRCNMAIGLLDDDPDRIISAALYVKGNK